MVDNSSEVSVPKYKTFKNPDRISIAQYCDENGFKSVNSDEFSEHLGSIVCDSVCPAMCRNGCEVEPDGKCEHGCPSLLLAAGMI